MKDKKNTPDFRIVELEERMEFALWSRGGGEGQDGCCHNDVCPCDDGPYTGGDALQE